jgi:hypothetical protein
LRVASDELGKDFGAASAEEIGDGRDFGVEGRDDAGVGRQRMSAKIIHDPSRLAILARGGPRL